MILAARPSSDTIDYKDTTRNQTFTYDPLNRLISAQNAGTNCAVTANGKTEYWGNSYNYDAWGNLLGKTITKCGAENLSVTALVNNQLSGYGYDAAGNMTHDLTSGLTYTFDQENRATGANGYTYTYDGDGNRVRKSNGNLAGNGTLYWYMTPGVVAETDLAGTTKSEYTFFGSERVARRDGVSGAGGVFYYFSDHLKTASVVTDSGGTIKAESDYYPWGGELQITANDSNHYKFTGKERDGETGLDYFGARYYGNALARFTSTDPKMFSKQRMFDPQQWNLYSYTRNNPLVYVDPDGRELKMVVFLEGGKGNDTYIKNGVMRAANAIHTAGVKNVTVEFRSGTPDSKTLSGLNKDHVTVFRIQDPSESL